MATGMASIMKVFPMTKKEGRVNYQKRRRGGKEREKGKERDPKESEHGERAEGLGGEKRWNVLEGACHLIHIYMMLERRPSKVQPEVGAKQYRALFCLRTRRGSASSSKLSNRRISIRRMAASNAYTVHQSMRFISLPSRLQASSVAPYLQLLRGSSLSVELFVNKGCAVIVKKPCQPLTGPYARQLFGVFQFPIELFENHML
jgi:hypothetical protein